MTTPSVKPRLNPWDLPRTNLGKYISRRAAELQKRYLAQNAAAKATLAQLRNGVRRPLGSDVLAWDAIIEAAFAAGEHRTTAMIGFVSTVVAAGLTSYYSWRLVFMTFFGHRAAHAVAVDHSDGATAAAGDHDHGHDDHAHDDHGHHAPHESPLVMLIPLAVLAVGALGAGYVFEPYFAGHDYTEFWKGALFSGEHNEILHEMHAIPAWAAY